jgi:hypothetical protein
MSNTARANLLRLRSGYVQQMVDAKTLLETLAEGSEEADEAHRWLAEVQSEVAIIDNMIRDLASE